MFDLKILHWNFIEENNDSTTFEGSLHSKMSIINFDHDFWDMLIVRKSIDFFNLMKVTSAFPIKELMTQRIIANLHHFFVYEIEFFITNRFESDL